MRKTAQKMQNVKSEWLVLYHMQYNLPVVETANLHVSSTKYFQEDVCNGLDLVLGKHSCIHLKLESRLREGRRGGGEGRGGEGKGRIT